MRARKMSFHHESPRHNPSPPIFSAGIRLTVVIVMVMLWTVTNCFSGGAQQNFL